MSSYNELKEDFNKKIKELILKEENQELVKFEDITKKKKIFKIGIIS